MLTFFRHRWPLGLLACTQALGVQAASLEQAITSKLQYRSALEGYRSFADESMQRSANPHAGHGSKP